MILTKTLKVQGWAICLLLVLFTFASCSKADDDILPPGEETPQPPQDDDLQSDTLELKVGYALEVSEEELIPTTRAEFGSRDLIGIQIYQLTKYDPMGYVCGVFDDLDKLVFKFVKGNRYTIQMTYYPNAKDIVYNYPDGTYGVPFSNLYGLKDYKLNEPVYFSGTGEPGTGEWGNTLTELLAYYYQPTEDRYNVTFKRGMTPRYSGTIEEITIDEGTQINVQLYLCMMAVTLNADNFTEGELTMTFSDQYMEDWVIKPGDDNSLQFQIPYNYILNSEGAHLYDGGGESMQLFYTTGDGEKYLLATKFLPYKLGVNYVFNFSITEREDGSIGIQMPSDDSFQDEVTSFD